MAHLFVNSVTTAKDGVTQRMDDLRQSTIPLIKRSLETTLECSVLANSLTLLLIHPHRVIIDDKSQHQTLSTFAVQITWWKLPNLQALQPSYSSLFMAHLFSAKFPSQENFSVEVSEHHFRQRTVTGASINIRTKNCFHKIMSLPTQVNYSWTTISTWWCQQ